MGNFNIQGSLPLVPDGFMVVAYCFLISTAKGLPQFVYDANSHIILAYEINSTLYLLVRQRLSLTLPSYWRNLLSSCDNPLLERNHSYSSNKVILFSKNIYFLLHIYYIIIFYKNQTMVARPGIEPGTPKTQNISTKYGGCSKSRTWFFRFSVWRWITGLAQQPLSIIYNAPPHGN